MKTRKTLSLVLLLTILLLVVWGMYYFSQNTTDSELNNTELPDTSFESIESPEAKGDVGVITKTSTTSIYTTNKYKLSFSYPSSWIIGDNLIGYGTFQLFNYDTSEVIGGSVFKKGMNKIEAVIINDPSGFFSESIENVIKTKIVGQKTYKLKSDIGISYAIELPSHPGKYLGISIYGDPTNYSVLESLVQSIGWIK